MAQQLKEAYEIERDEAEGRNAFTGYGEGYVEVNGKRHAASLVVSGERLVTDWPAASIEPLTADHLAAIVELKPEIVLLGDRAKFALPRARAPRAALQRGHRRGGDGHARGVPHLQHPAGRGPQRLAALILPERCAFQGDHRRSGDRPQWR